MADNGGVSEPAWTRRVEDVRRLAAQLLNADPLEIDSNYEPKKGTPVVRVPVGELYLPLEGLVDVEAEKARLKKELEKIEAEIAKVEALSHTQPPLRSVIIFSASRTTKPGTASHGWWRGSTSVRPAAIILRYPATTRMMPAKTHHHAEKPKR